LIFSFLLGFLGIALAVGIPLILTVNRQAASQSQLLLDQAVLSARALLAGEQADLENLALLVSQRPSLVRLLQQQDASALKDYVVTLQKGAGLDLLLICSGGSTITGAGDDVPAAEYCQSDSISGFSFPASTNNSYLYTSSGLEVPGQSVYRIVIGKRLSLVLSRLQGETGLKYFLIRQGRVIEASDPQLNITNAQTTALEKKANTPTSSTLVRLADHQYLLGSLSLDTASGLTLIPALNVDDQLAVRRNLIITLLLGMLSIVLIASVLGLFLSQRISEPIARLAEAATGFRQGNLNAPVSVRSSIWEISQLANTLEDARVALQHSLNQLQAKTTWNEALLNSIVEGIVTLDHQDRITFASAGLARMTEDEAAPVLGRKIDEVFPAAEGELAFSSQMPEVGQQRRISIRLKNGESRLLSVSKASFVPPEAENANRALVIRDVTHDEYLHRLLGDFLANITHEFRTPLAALEASSELLRDNFRNLPKEEMEELLVSLNLGIIDLQTLIDNLIEAASIEAGRFKVSVQPVPFEGILGEAIDLVQPLAKKYSLKLDVSPAAGSGLVMADQRRTVQVLVNLLSNAIKHSPENGAIQVDWEVNEGKLRVEVTDEGSGFADEQHHNLFRRFSHLETSEERSRHGAGLGLSVVKAIVEAQQGQVGIRDTHGHGASIWFSIPVVGGASE
jgi:signal transduction histidine kinase